VSLWYVYDSYHCFRKDKKWFFVDWNLFERMSIHEPEITRVSRKWRSQRVATRGCSSTITSLQYTVLLFHPPKNSGLGISRKSCPDVQLGSGFFNLKHYLSDGSFCHRDWQRPVRCVFINSIERFKTKSMTPHGRNHLAGFGRKNHGQTKISFGAADSHLLELVGKIWLPSC